MKSFVNTIIWLKFCNWVLPDPNPFCKNRSRSFFCPECLLIRYSLSPGCLTAAGADVRARRPRCPPAKQVHLPIQMALQVRHVTVVTCGHVWSCRSGSPSRRRAGERFCGNLRSQAHCGLRSWRCVCYLLSTASFWDFLVKSVSLCKN